MIDEAATIDRLVAARRQGAPEADPELAAAREALFGRYRPRLVGFCTRYLGDPVRGEDVAQRALEVAWRKLPEFRQESRFSTWLFGIARRTAFRALRSPREVLLEDGVFEPESEELAPIRALTHRERARMVREAAAELAPLDQEVLFLRCFEGLPWDAIERALDLDRADMRSGARGVLQRCRRHLAAHMRKWLEEHGHGSSFLKTGP
jgi:RNA polymerase sigma-70 factor (ECF subfamily)